MKMKNTYVNNGDGTTTIFFRKNTQSVTIDTADLELVGR